MLKCFAEFSNGDKISGNSSYMKYLAAWAIYQKNEEPFIKYGFSENHTKAEAKAMAECEALGEGYSFDITSTWYAEPEAEAERETKVEADK